MSDERGPTELLDERPELESALAAALAVDDEHDAWRFDDIDVDSGAFGELVSHGVVEKRGDEYAVADPAAVRRALDGDDAVGDETANGEREFDLDWLAVPAVDGRAAGLLTAALAVVVLTRTYVVGSVYRGGDIVFSGNDAYFYRYLVEQVAAEASGGADFAALSVLPTDVTKGEPLLVATLWWVAELLGGTTETIGHVLAWYPVVSAVISGVFVYLLAVRVTSDRRVGLASVLFLALIPGHALRTSLGFADHHAFDYPWLGLTALALLLVVTTARDRASLRSPVPWAGGVLLGVGITGQVLAWEAGPLLIVPVGVVVAAKTLLDVKAGRAPLLANLPLVGGTGLAAALVWTVHTNWEWHTELVASTPLLLFLGVCSVVATAAVVARAGGTARQLAAVEGVAFVVGLFTVRSLFSERWDEAFSRTDALFRSDAIAETVGLFDPGTIGFLLLFGFGLVMALPVMVLGVQFATRDRADWLVVAVYAWYFLGLAAIQVRFVGELATFAAVFAGYAFVWLAAKVELARPVTGERTAAVTDALVPEPRMLGLLCVLFLLVGSLGLVQVPVKTGQVTVDGGQYQTATAIERDASEHGLEHPENYVLSQWGKNRMYNYFVSGESRSYAYARNTYEPFVSSTNESEWYDRLRGRVGYVVTEYRAAEPETMQSRLHTRYGSRNGSVAGLGHYQAVYATDSGSHKAFALVPGATLSGTASPNATVTATATVSVPNGEFEYVRQTAVDADGRYGLVVANPGNYTVESDGETSTVTVNESAVRNGTRVTAD
ncbi:MULTISPECIES: STT3 domain-containing protein [Haloarcula]|uniref:STT3 domain-containing protein n=1 Tax=Haloarcula TaxID=2237 RepID=UPI0023E8BD24|nr:STT3 domain-containing protein [Halomicroarcula sp. SHR3]